MIDAGACGGPQWGTFPVVASWLARGALMGRFGLLKPGAESLAAGQQGRLKRFASPGVSRFARSLHPRTIRPRFRQRMWGAMGTSELWGTRVLKMSGRRDIDRIQVGVGGGDKSVLHFLNF